jgi:hypothetical protein
VCSSVEVTFRIFSFNSKKFGRGGKDRPPGIILRRDRNMVPVEKILEPCPPPSLAERHRPLCNSPASGWRAGHNPEAGGGGGTTRVFFNQARNLPPRRIEPETWRCYSEALTITLETLSLSFNSTKSKLKPLHSSLLPQLYRAFGCNDRM